MRATAAVFVKPVPGIHVVVRGSEVSSEQQQLVKQALNSLSMPPETLEGLGLASLNFQPDMPNGLVGMLVEVHVVGNGFKVCSTKVRTFATALADQVRNAMLHLGDKKWSFAYSW